MQFLINKIAESYNPAYRRGTNTKARSDSISHRARNGFFTPLLAPLLQNRRATGFFLMFGIAQLLLVFTEITGWQCPIYGTLGIICPGCGMSNAMASLLQGHWQTAVQTHAFAPVVLIVLMMLVAAIGLPAAHLNKFAGRVERLEQKSGITAILLLSMLVYWLLRLFDFI